MNFMVRPSKSFLFDRLEKELGKTKTGVGLDAGSATFKNRPMFKTGTYIGLDIDKQRVETGLKRYPDERTLGLVADLNNLYGLPSDSIDVIASTNTLYCLPVAARVRTVDKLCRITAPKGRLLFEVPIDDGLSGCLSAARVHFSSVKVVYYRNPVSRFYENIFMDERGYLGSHPVAGSRPFRLLAWLLSRTEYVTQSSRSLNRQAFIIAERKKDAGPKNDLDLSELKKISDRLYSLVETNKPHHEK
ncbi:MAG: methyltransferase domain-containing protein [Minisyncoccia bacterium]|jgi:SAM-dependent methyltransferase